MSDILYNIVIEREDGGEIVIDWGTAPGWIDTCRDHLNRARGIALVPKDGAALPVVRVGLGECKRWVIFSRVAGHVNAAGQHGPARIRVYCIGWQSTVRGVNVKALTWVYPGGAIESADEPTMIEAFLRAAEGGEQ